VLSDILAASASDENTHLDDLLHETIVKAIDERRGTILMDIMEEEPSRRGIKDSTRRSYLR
jgi:hypothetical protein